MAQIFRPGATTLFRCAIAGGFLSFVGLLVFGDALQKSTYITEVNLPKEQNPPFSHKHHTSLGIDCRYCHTTAETSSFAGIPPTRTCMNCHSQIWNESPMLAAVRESWRTGESLKWNRVHDLPQFVYFNHSVHVNKGIGCASCHGRVDQMPLVRRENTLYMGWCLDCHRDPSKFIRPRENMTDMAYATSPEQQTKIGAELVQKYHVNTNDYRMLDCYNCHR